MKVDQLLVDAKLTESDFQSARFELISRYRDLETVFHMSELPSRNGKYSSFYVGAGDELSQVLQHWVRLKASPIPELNRQLRTVHLPELCLERKPETMPEGGDEE